MIKNKIIGIFGGGVMGSVFVEAIRKLDRNVKIVVCDRDRKKLRAFRKLSSNIKTTENINDIITSTILVLAIKPQDFLHINFHVSTKILVVSLMAGVPMDVIKKRVGARKVVKLMPNTPARLGKGFTVWTTTKSVTAAEKNFAKKLFRMMGEEMYVSTEVLIDKATAVTGSGPAYIFYTASSFIKAAQSLGFSEKDAKRMVLKTLEGAVALLKQGPDPEILIEQVASKGGTTEAALQKFKENNLEQIWDESIKAAFRRSRELGGE